MAFFITETCLKQQIKADSFHSTEVQEALKEQT